MKEINMDSMVALKKMRLVCLLIKLSMIMGMIIFGAVILIIGPRGQEDPGKIVWIFLLIPFGVEFVALMVYPFIKKNILNASDAPPVTRLMGPELSMYVLMEGCGITGLVFTFLIFQLYNPQALPWYLMYLNFIHPAAAIMLMLSRPLPELPDTEWQGENQYAQQQDVI